MSPQQARAERDRFVALAFCWADVTLELDQDRKVAFAGGITDALLGKGAKDLAGRPFGDLVAPKDKNLLDQLLDMADKSGRLDDETVRFDGKSGPVPIRISGYRMPDMDHHYFLGLRLGRPSNPTHPEKPLARDPGSGLYDADSFADVATERIKAALEKGDKDSKLTLVDVGLMDELRGRMEDEAFEELQRTIGVCLMANSVNGDAAGRIDEGRYGVLHSKDTDVAELEARIAEYAKDADPTGQGVEVSSGTMSVDADALAGGDIAQGLVYVINQFRQSRGKDLTLSCLSDNLSSMVAEASDTLSGFREIVETSNFEMAFQPIIDVRDNSHHHYEVLARFPNVKTEDGGSPFRFITFAEEMGLIADFDMAMAKKAMEWLRTSKLSGRRIAVNLSGYSIGLPSFVDELERLVAANPWSSKKLIFEITESAQIDDLNAVNRVIRMLRGRGHEVCLDDFGAGAANFQYLSTLEVDVIKLDGPALKQAMAGSRGKAYVKALSALCSELKIDIIAEMIDDEEGLRFIKDCGIRFAQGYYFARPSLDIGVFTDWSRVKRRAGGTGRIR